MLNIKKLLTKILTHFGVQKVTLDTNYCYAYVKKQGNVVTLNIVGKAISITSGTWTTICTLPQNFRPESRTDFVAYDNNTTNHSIVSAPIRIETDGRVNVWPYETSSKQLCGTVSFMTAYDPESAPIEAPPECTAYVVDHGTSGIWTYKKWSDGTAECCGLTSVASRTYAAGGYYNVVENLPSGLFITTPNVVIASGRINTCVNTSVGFTAANNASQIQTYLINRNASAVTNASGVYWIVKGRWK